MERGFNERIKKYFNAINNKSIKADINNVLNDISDDSKLYILAIVPGLIAFVNWVLDEAINLGKTRLYFLSRDGYQMYLIAEKLVEYRGLNIECRYLNVSRYSMRLPGYHLDIDSSIDEICVGGIDVTYTKILKRGGLSNEECQVVIEDLGIGDDRDKILNYQDVLKLRGRLGNNELLKKYIYMYSLASYRECASYLDQEGLMKDDKYAIVDSGWVGTLQCSIERIVKSVNPGICVDGFYFGMYETPYGADSNRFHSYYFGAKSGLIRKSRFSNSLFETIVSSCEGMTTGYKLDNQGQYFPVKNTVVNPNQDVISRNVEALNKLLETISDYSEWMNIGRKTIKCLFDLFMAKPSQYELRCYGDNRFSDDIIDGQFKKVAAELNYDQIKDQRLINKLLIISGIRKRTIHESAWIEGSIVRCGRNIKYSLWHVRMYKLLIYARKQIQN